MLLLGVIYVEINGELCIKNTNIDFNMTYHYTNEIVSNIMLLCFLTS